MTTTTNPSPDVPRRRSLAEFVAMMALVYATVAFSIDSMLPSLPEIAAELVPHDVNRAQLILSIFMVGMGIGTLFVGPLSDAFGRKAIISLGFTIYLVGSVMAFYAQSVEILFLARFIQGVGSSGPRIVVMAMIRDLYEGRRMAQVMSFVNMLFIMVPAMSPSLGQLIIMFAGWRGLFLAFIVFALLAWVWVGLRQDETLPRARRRPLSMGSVTASLIEAARDRDVRICTLTLALGFGQMFALLSSAQQLFGETYGRGNSFPLWFAAMAVLSSVGTITNAKMVMFVGMRRMASMAYAMQAVFALIMVVVTYFDLLPDVLRFPAFFIWSVSLYLMAGVTFGNLNSIALQRMGHIAGMVASLVSAGSTVLAMVIGAPVGYLYNGTAVPVMLSAAICSAVAWLLMRALSPGA